MYPECPPCEGCQNCNPCKRLDTIIGLLRQQSDDHGDTSPPSVTENPTPFRTDPPLSWPNSNTFDLSYVPDSTAWAFSVPIPGRSPWYIEFGTNPSQWRFNGNGIPEVWILVLQNGRMVFRAVLKLLLMWRFGHVVMKLLYSF